MKSRATDQFLAALQATVSTAVKQWQDENKREAMRLMQAAVMVCVAAKCEQQQQQNLLQSRPLAAQVFPVISCQQGYFWVLLQFEGDVGKH